MCRGASGGPWASSPMLTATDICRGRRWGWGCSVALLCSRLGPKRTGRCDTWGARPFPLSSAPFHSLTHPCRGNHVCDGGPAPALSVNEDEGRTSRRPPMGTPPRAPQMGTPHGPPTGPPPWGPHPWAPPTAPPWAPHGPPHGPPSTDPPTGPPPTLHTDHTVYIHSDSTLSAFPSLPAPLGSGSCHSLVRAVVIRLTQTWSEAIGPGEEQKEAAT